MANAIKKEILVYFLTYQIFMLIPKQRGQGYKRQPLGHHICPLSELAYEIGFDLYGLGGHLEVCTGYMDPDDHPRLIEKAVKPISALLNYDFRIVGYTEFWQNHPIKSNSPVK